MELAVAVAIKKLRIATGVKSSCAIMLDDAHGVHAVSGQCALSFVKLIL